MILWTLCESLKSLCVLWIDFYNWFLNVKIFYSEHSKVAVTPLSAVYEIYSVSPDDEGSYTCQATNAVGIVEERIQIRIEDDDDVPCTGDRGDIPCDDRQIPTDVCILSLHLQFFSWYF